MERVYASWRSADYEKRCKSCLWTILVAVIGVSSSVFFLFIKRWKSGQIQGKQFNRMVYIGDRINCNCSTMNFENTKFTKIFLNFHIHYLFYWPEEFQWVFDQILFYSLNIAIKQKRNGTVQRKHGSLNLKQNISFLKWTTFPWKSI